MTDKIMIFIPMYNCENQISRVISKVKKSDRKLFAEIVVVDNISRDKSLESAQKALSKIKEIKTTLLKNKENYSLGGSHKVAFNYALKKKYDYVIVLHGDDQGNINDLIPYIKNKEYKKYDSFLGSRFAIGSKLIGYSKFRIFGNILTNIACSIATRSIVSDMGSGLNMYKTSYLKSKSYLYFPNNLTFNVYLLFHGIWSKSKLKFFPLTWRDEDQVSNARVFKQWWIIMKLLFKYFFGARWLFNKKENKYSKIDYESEIIFAR